MRTLAEDTDPNAERVLIALLRGASPARNSPPKPTVLCPAMSEADAELLAAIARLVVAFDACWNDALTLRSSAGKLPP